MKINIKNKRELFVTLVFLVFLQYFLPKIYRSHVKLNKLIKEKKDLNLIHENVKINIMELDQDIEKLDDPYYIEKISREKLQMRKKGEVIYRLTD
ncbi:FtsB family cell division protein [Ilyobacter polytropus]|uniref:Septum formation initiator n=1 Tax=Ilyobacter polytropus (strain ATCC 51220 / DSM 2926 / LMG 16218 / CuHBu1) TaxID=572544 RepID=E3HA14_ILYPC|nr:septum formation initiator family protein [Ilyobacter polytropus]ADO83142.1 Septum formation initiator [Ilyobacter polytropus DSM 2926]